MTKSRQEYGVPYSIEEAKMMVADPAHRRAMDPYHLEMMEFLISECEYKTEVKPDVITG